MTRTEALARARKRWGKDAIIQAGERNTSPERRAAALAEVKATNARMDAITEEINKRLAELPWYRELIDERRALYKQRERARGEAHHYKFNVGKQEIGCFFIKGSGDTWEEAFAAAEGK